jgi:hypothetical protein
MSGYGEGAYGSGPYGGSTLTSSWSQSGHDLTSWIDVLDTDDNLLYTLPHEGLSVTGGDITKSTSQTVRGQGSIDLYGTVDLLSVRFRPWREVDENSWSLGIFVPETPDTGWSGLGASRSVGILDKLTLLDRAKRMDEYALPIGTVVTDAVRDLIEWAGASATGITDMDSTLRTAVTWDRGASVLSIINDLLDAINCFSLWVDGSGRYQVTPYVAPSSRPIVAEFIHGENATFIDEWTESRDLASVPNHFAAYTSGDDETEGLFAEAYNDNPDDPLSTLYRGIVSADPETVETTDQATLDSYVARRLIEVGTVTRTVEIEHVPMNLNLNDAVVFTHPASGIDGRFVVTKTVEPIDEVALQKTTLREVTS